MAERIRVLCVGDRFITPDALGLAAKKSIGRDTYVTGLQTEWPDDPFGPVEGVTEASGSPAAVARLAQDADVLLTHLGPVTRSVLNAATDLKVVGITRGGPVNVDLAAATERGVPVVYLPGRNLGAAAEFTLGFMLALPRGIASGSRALAAGQWDPTFFRQDRTGPELRGSTVGIVGAGAVGRRVAELVSAFRANVLIHDPFADEQSLRDQGWEPVGLDELLARSDIVSLHARLTDDTRKMFGTDVFAAMKPGAYFVNTARGGLVDEDALRGALESGHLAGAALDVFDPEPPVAGDALVARADVIATPHLAGASKQVASESAARVADEVATYLRDGVLEHCANPDWQQHAAQRS
ncbi:2-hydroxyacid dehydrogenase [uncultured Jatrophihabitans sp.]|uniref:2-hydroxyacid dehydrogenase n=1 Tax=uncultured Jatrophihabitans sp. TaxID=1610747 RepID=UPI0035CB4E70